MIDNPSQETLVSRAQAGDVLAFTELYWTHRNQIRKYLAHLVSHHDQWPDLDQETFLPAWRSLPELCCAHQFTSWLYCIAHNRAMSFLREVEREKKHHQRLSDDEEYSSNTHPSTPGPEEQIAEEDRLKRALRGLEPQCRDCLLLYVVVGFSLREIATMLGIHESTISANVCRGRKYLRSCKSLEKRDL